MRRNREIDYDFAHSSPFRDLPFTMSVLQRFRSAIASNAFRSGSLTSLSELTWKPIFFFNSTVATSPLHF
jgi:hypothetical protein